MNEQYEERGLYSHTEQNISDSYKLDLLTGDT